MDGHGVPTESCEGLQSDGVGIAAEAAPTGSGCSDRQFDRRADAGTLWEGLQARCEGTAAEAAPTGQGEPISSSTGLSPGSFTCTGCDSMSPSWRFASPLEEMRANTSTSPSCESFSVGVGLSPSSSTTDS